jgi:hypothetical protein
MLLSWALCTVSKSSHEEGDPASKMRGAAFLMALCVAGLHNSYSAASPLNFVATSFNSREGWWSNLTEKLWNGTAKNAFPDGSIPRSERAFVIHGWRWHTISVLRDLDRLQLLLCDVLDRQLEVLRDFPTARCTLERVTASHDFACNFNLRALRRVEEELFVPWLARILPREGLGEHHKLQEVREHLREVREHHKLTQRLAAQVDEHCASLADLLSAQSTSKSMGTGRRLQVASALRHIERLVVQIRGSVRHTQSAQQGVFGPCIAAHASVKEQWVYNRQVITILGLVDCQVHLVSFREAIASNPSEVRLYKSHIPRIAQALIPVWKSSFYLPRTRCFSLEKSRETGDS